MDAGAERVLLQPKNRAFALKALNQKPFRSPALRGFVTGKIWFSGEASVGQARRIRGRGAKLTHVSERSER